MKVNLRKTVFNGIAVAMGTVVLVAHFVNPMSPGDAASLLAMGVAALGLANLQK